MVIGNRIDHDIESPKECESLGLSLGLAAFTAVVYPLAYVVSRYTCRDRSQEIEYTDHDIPPSCCSV